MLSPQGFVSECTGENIFVARDGVLITPPRRRRGARGHHPGHASSPSPRTSGFEVRFDYLTRSDLYVCEEMFVCGTAAEVVGGQLGRRPPDPVPRPDDHRHRRRVRQGRARPGRPLQGLGRACPLNRGARRRQPARPRRHPGTARRGRDLRHDAARRRPVRGHLAHASRTSCGSPSSSTGSACTGSRAATRRPTRRTRSSSAGPAVELDAVERRAGGVRLDPAPGRQGRRRPHARAPCVGAGTSTVCIVGKSWDFHVTEALRTTLDEGVAMVGESVAFLKAEGLRVFFDAEHFFDGYKANPEYALRVLEAAAVNGADCVVLCDTNGGSLPHEVAAHHRRGRRLPRRRLAVGIHTQNDTGCAVANSVAAVLGGATPGAGHDQRLRRAHRQRQPHDGHPRPRRSSWGSPPCPRAASTGSPSSATTWPSW